MIEADIRTLAKLRHRQQLHGREGLTEEQRISLDALVARVMPRAERGRLGSKARHEKWKAMPLQQRVEAFFTPEPNSGCWLWHGTIDGAGYGRLKRSGLGTDKAHRIVWTLHRGPIQQGLVIDHICRVKSCVNPDHLRVVTRQQNTIENSMSGPALNAAKTHCFRGHPLTGPDAEIRLYRKSIRRCLRCERINNNHTYRRSRGWTTT